VRHTRLDAIKTVEGITLLHLDHSGINPEAIAWYEFLPNGAGNGSLAKLNLIVDGSLLEIEGAEAQMLFDHVRSLPGVDLLSLPTSEEKQNALESLKAFFATAFGEYSNTLLTVTPSAKQTAEKALSVLGA
jgi:hypothetical protein